MDKIETIQDLVKILENKFRLREKKKEVLTYVIYARKSSEEKDKQLGSVEDQVLVCKEFAKKNNLFVKEILTESKSAKDPDNRPVFTKMLRDLKRGFYDGIIAWYPDRLSRNMREAGEIIDMLDKAEILDLKFPSFTFVNDPSGKMLLGIIFVMSKEYTDQLSQNVKRGTKAKTKSGIYVNKAKHGYKKGDDKRLYLDEKNFYLTREAFQMRLKGKTLDKILNF